jgi:hypothetical protein
MRFTLLLILLASISHAQEFKKLKAGVGLGLGYRPSSGDFGMVIINFEPAYRVSDRTAVGIRIQNGFGPGGQSLYSYAAFGQRYFSNDHFRPFVGLGIGGYTHSGLEASGFGVYPRIGFDFRHLTFNTDFDIVGGAINGNFLTFKIAVSIGGGRKNK